MLNPANELWRRSAVRRNDFNALGDCSPESRSPSGMILTPQENSITLVDSMVVQALGTLPAEAEKVLIGPRPGSKPIGIPKRFPPTETSEPGQEVL
jgi:hypothetical protein